MRNLAIIPARGGSKRIPGKNIREFAGRPIVEYTLEVALRSGIFDRVVVSTDSPRIAEISTAAGGEVPFMRPDHLSDDHALPVDAILYTVERLQEEGEEYDNVCVLFATAPFLEEGDLQRGLGLLAAGAPAAFGVAAFGFPILRALRMGDDGTVEMYWPEHELTRSNDLPAAYHDVGQFYWITTDELLAQRRIYVPGARGVLIPSYRAQDIDTEEDWERAELLYAAARQSPRRSQQADHAEGRDLRP